MGELGQSPQKRSSPGPEAARRAIEATGKAVAEEVSGEAGCDPASTASVAAAGGPHFVEVVAAAEGFMEAAVLIQAIA